MSSCDRKHTWILHKVFLMVVLCIEPFAGFDNFRCDGLVDLRLLQLIPLAFSLPLLLVRVVEDRTPVLCADIIALPIRCSRVMYPEEVFHLVGTGRCQANKSDFVYAKAC